MTLTMANFINGQIQVTDHDYYGQANIFFKQINSCTYVILLKESSTKNQLHSLEDYFSTVVLSLLSSEKYTSKIVRN